MSKHGAHAARPGRHRKPSILDHWLSSEPAVTEPTTPDPWTLNHWFSEPAINEPVTSEPISFDDHYKTMKAATSEFRPASFREHYATLRAILVTPLRVPGHYPTEVIPAVSA